MPALVEVADSSLMAKALGARSPDLLDLAKKAEGDPELLLGALDALGSVSPRTRVAASKMLCILSERSPEVLYPQFEVLARVLRQEKGILKRNAMLTLANLAAVDRANKFDTLLDEFLAPIAGTNISEAASALHAATTVARLRPALADRIAKFIVRVEKVEYASRDGHNQAIGHVIGALADFFPALHDPHGVRLFVRRQLRNPRVAVRNKARRFLQKWPAHNGHKVHQASTIDLNDDFVG